MKLRIWKPTLDCNDIEAKTTFWTWLLGIGVTGERGSTRFLGPPGGRPVLCLQKVDEGIYP
jgi:hypothetical protein